MLCATCFYWQSNNPSDTAECRIDPPRVVGVPLIKPMEIKKDPDWISAAIPRRTPGGFGCGKWVSRLSGKDLKGEQAVLKEHL